MKASRYTYLLLAAVCAFVLLAYTALGLPCPVRALLGIPCPGCGMSRAWLAILRLDFSAAFGYHPMFWAVVPAFLAAARGGKLTGRKKLDASLLLGLLAGFVICYIVRLWYCLGG